MHNILTVTWEILRWTKSPDAMTIYWIQPRLLVSNEITNAKLKSIGWCNFSQNSQNVPFQNPRIQGWTTNENTLRITRHSWKSLLQRLIIFLAIKLARRLLSTSINTLYFAKVVRFFTQPFSYITAGCLMRSSMDPQHPLIAIDLQKRKWRGHKERSVVIKLSR